MALFSISVQSGWTTPRREKTQRPAANGFNTSSYGRRERAPASNATSLHAGMGRIARGSRPIRGSCLLVLSATSAGFLVGFARHVVQKQVIGLTKRNAK